jgi:CSLREA domain-containing protein
MAAAALVLLGSSRGARAATIVVDTFSDELNADGDCSLREAIEAANIDSPVDGCSAGSDADLIEIPPGTYPLTVPPVTIGNNPEYNDTGDLDVRSDVIIQGTGSSPSILDGAGLTPDRILNVLPPDGTHQLDPPTYISVTLRNLRFTQGGGASLISGGGIRVQNYAGYSVALLVQDCVFDGNSASSGGGMSVEDRGPTTIRHCSFLNNSSGGDGGGLTTIAPTLIEDCTFAGNTVNAGLFQPGGGGILVNGPTTIRRSTVSGNDSGGSSGGGIACQAVDLFIEDSTVSGNTSTGQGGGGIIQGKTAPTRAH